MKYILKLFITLLATTLLFASFIYIVDPYDKLNNNILNLKIKGVFDYRTNKFRDIDKNVNKYEAFILGSSRAMQLQPSIVEDHTGYKTYNYSAYTANAQDYLAMTKHILRTQKPKLIWIHLDFYSFNSNMKTMHELFSSPLNNYINEEVVQKDSSKLDYFLTKYYSFEALRDTFIIVKKNITSTAQKHYKENGENYSVFQQASNYKLLEEYWDKEYKNYTIDSNRLSMLKEIKKLSEQNNIELLISLSPLSYSHFSKLQNDENLNAKVLQVKKELCSIFGSYRDFLNDDIKLYSQPSYWIDSVHPSTNMGKLLSNTMFTTQKKGFGEKVNCLIAF